MISQFTHELKAMVTGNVKQIWILDLHRLPWHQRFISVIQIVLL
jgi:hypothetical protein